MKIRSGFVSNSSSSSFIVKTRIKENEVYDIIYRIALKNSKRELTITERSNYWYSHTQFYGMTESEIKNSIDNNIKAIFYDKDMPYYKKKEICEELNDFTMYGFSPYILDSGYKHSIRYSCKNNTIHKMKTVFSTEICKSNMYVIVVTTENYIHIDFYNDLRKHFRFKTFNHLG